MIPELFFRTKEPATGSDTVRRCTFGRYEDEGPDGGGLPSKDASAEGGVETP